MTGLIVLVSVAVATFVALSRGEELVRKLLVRCRSV